MITATGIITEIRKEQQHKVPALWDLPRGATIKTLGEEWLVSLVHLEDDPEDLHIQFGDDFMYYFPVSSQAYGIELFENIKKVLTHEALVNQKIKMEGVQGNNHLYLQIQTKKIYAIDFNYSGNY